MKREINLGSYETLLVELRLEDECNYKNYLRMTSENFEETSQLIKDVIAKENTKIRDPIPHRLLAFYQQGNHTIIMFLSIVFSTQQ